MKHYLSWSILAKPGTANTLKSASYGEIIGTYLNTFFNYPQDIRQVIYITSAIESLNSVIRRALKKRKVFPHDDSAKKMEYLAIKEASKKWTMPIRNWRTAMSRFMIEFEDRLTNHIH